MISRNTRDLIEEVALFSGAGLIAIAVLLTIIKLFLLIRDTYGVSGLIITLFTVGSILLFIFFVVRR